MACTYNYETGKITLDFHLVRFNEICTLRGIRGKVGAPGCITCPYHKGIETSSFTEYYVKCKHPEAQDSEGSSDIYFDICERFRKEALSHYYD